jgi:hypothetical protein
MAASALQASSQPLNVVSREKRGHVAASLGRKPKGRHFVKDLSSDFPDRGEVVAGAAGNGAGVLSSDPINKHSTSSVCAPQRYAIGGCKSMAQKDENLPSVAAAISDALRSEFSGARDAAKTIARSVSATPRTVKGWLAGDAAPRAAELVRLMAEFDEVYLAVLCLAGRAPTATLTPSQRQAVAEALRILEGK